MWNSPDILPDRVKVQSDSQEDGRDDDFFAMFEADIALKPEAAPDILCSRQILLEGPCPDTGPDYAPGDVTGYGTSYGTGDETGSASNRALAGDLIVFRHNAGDLVEFCATLTLSLAGSGYFDKTLRCTILDGQPLPVCLITTGDTKDGQESFSPDQGSTSQASTNQTSTGQAPTGQTPADLLKILEKKKLRPLKQTFKSADVDPEKLSAELSDEPLSGANNPELLKNLAVLTLLPEVAGQQDGRLPFQAVALTGFVTSDSDLAEALLRHVNKLFAGTSVHAASVDHAMMLLGQGRFLRWLSAKAVLRLGRLCGRRGVALLALRRASLLAALKQHAQPPHRPEQYALNKSSQEKTPASRNKTDESTEDYFLAGLLSLLPLLTGCGLENIVAALELHLEREPASQEAWGFRAEPRNLLGNPTAFAETIDLLEALEQADWQNLDSCLNKLGLTEPQLGNAFIEAVTWEVTL